MIGYEGDYSVEDRDIKINPIVIFNKIKFAKAKKVELKNCKFSPNSI